MLTDLEILQRTESRLAARSGYSYDFTDWSQCTCGHVYAAAYSGTHENGMREAVYDEPWPNSQYDQALRTIVMGNLDLMDRLDMGEYLADEDYSSANLVSDATDNLAHYESIDHREAALRLVRAARVALEQRYRANAEEAARRAEFDGPDGRDVPTVHATPDDSDRAYSEYEDRAGVGA